MSDVKVGWRERPLGDSPRLDQIIDAAAVLFARNGYAATGVAELCDAVGLGRGSLYHYIDSKERLLADIHARVMTELLTTAEDISTLDAPPAARLRLLSADLIRVITRYPDHVWVLLHEWQALTGDLAADFRSRRRNYEHLVESVLTAGADAGVFRISDPRLAVMAWLGMHNSVYQWYRPGGHARPAQIANHFHQLFIDGIAPPGTTRPVTVPGHRGLAR